MQSKKRTIEDGTTNFRGMGNCGEEREQLESFTGIETWDEEHVSQVSDFSHE